MREHRQHVGWCDGIGDASKERSKAAPEANKRATGEGMAAETALWTQREPSTARHGLEGIRVAPKGQGWLPRPSQPITITLKGAVGVEDLSQGVRG